MSGYLFEVGASAMCPHGGQVKVTSTNTRVKVGGKPVALVADTFLVSGCAFTIPPGKPQPCMKVQWLTPATRVKVGGQAPILKTSNGLCQSADQIPQGPPNVSSTQTKVKGT
jgi:hypothetical protein